MSKKAIDAAATSQLRLSRGVRVVSCPYACDNEEMKICFYKLSSTISGRRMEVSGRRVCPQRYACWSSPVGQVLEQHYTNGTPLVHAEQFIRVYFHSFVQRPSSGAIRHVSSVPNRGVMETKIAF